MLRYLGENPDDKDARALARAEAQLLKVRRYIRKFHSSQYIDDLASGSICLAMGWSGDVLQAKIRAEQAGKGV
ncbi:spermidine/putrescine ABC transporter substrate-binding protein PotF, partial [Streptomyces niveiscabiei]